MKEDGKKKMLIIMPIAPAYRKDFLELLKTKLQERNISLEVVVGNKFHKEYEKLNSENLSICELNTKCIKLFNFNIYWLIGLYKYISQRKYDDVVLLYNPLIVNFIFAYLYFYLKRIRIHIWSSGYERSNISRISKFFRNVYLNTVYKCAYSNIVYSKSQFDNLLAKGLNGEKISIARNTLSVDPMLILRDDISIYNILYVGAIEKNKNVENLIAATKNINLSQSNKIKLNVVGDGSVREDLQNKYSSNEIQFYGYLNGDKLKEIFISSSLFVLPGIGGLAVNHAMAYSLPIIATRGDGTISDLINGNGYLLDTGSVNEIESKILEFMSLSLDEKRKMSKMSYYIYCEYYSLENMVNGFIKNVS